MIKKRLRSLTKYIDKNDKIIDVAADHGLLAIYLNINNINKNITISDINEYSINKAKENINKYNLNNSIKAFVNDGIKNIDNKYNTLIISGLGGVNIINILKDKNINIFNKIILQPTSDIYKVRDYLTNNNYYISDEDIIYDNKHYYTNIVFKSGKKRYSTFNLKYGPYAKYKNINYFKDRHKKETEIYKSIPISNYKTKIKQLFKITEIKYILLINKHKEKRSKRTNNHHDN